MTDANLQSELIEGQISKPQPMALEGVRVVDLTVVGAGPVATRLLGQLGAEILKIELPGVGERYRQHPVVVPGVPPCAMPNPVFEDTNQNKKSVTLDLHKEKGREILYQLVAKSDIFTSNLLPEALKRFKADYETLARYNPKLVYARGNVFGPNGPDANKHGAAAQGAAISGMMTLNSYFETTGEPIPAIGMAADTVHALAMAYGVLAALIARDRLGIGQEVTLSQLGVCMNILLSSELIRELVWGVHSPQNPRNKNPALRNRYRCKDGKWMMLTMDEERYDNWHQLCAELGKPELANDPRFQDRQSRIENNEALMKIIEGGFLTKTRAEWDSSFRQAGLDWLCRINTLSDLANEPQVLANNYIWEVDHPQYGRIKLPGHPVTFTKTPATLQSFAPEVGQHTEIVLMDLLGYSRDEVARLREEGVI